MTRRTLHNEKTTVSVNGVHDFLPPSFLLVREDTWDTRHARSLDADRSGDKVSCLLEKEGIENIRCL